MAKKHKKHSTKKLKEPKQTESPKQRKEYIWKYLRIFWYTWSVAATLLTFWLGYLALRPSVTIDYASHLIALPIRVTNNGLLPLYNIKCIMDANIVDRNNNHSSVREIVLLTNKLSHHKSVDHIYYAFRTVKGPQKGNVIVTINYELPMIHTNYSEQQRFEYFKTLDRYTRWRLVQ